jgi:hypothetical protein
MMLLLMKRSACIGKKDYKLNNEAKFWEWLRYKIDVYGH